MMIKAVMTKVWVAVGRYWVTRKQRNNLKSKFLTLKLYLATLNPKKGVSKNIIEAINIIQNYV
jgi:hypothetical protein